MTPLEEAVGRLKAKAERGGFWQPSVEVDGSDLRIVLSALEEGDLQKMQIASSRQDQGSTPVAAGEAEADAAVSELIARVRVLEEALRPFARFNFEGATAAHKVRLVLADRGPCQLEVTDFERAASALSGTSGDGPRAASATPCKSEGEP